jgi:hypothetical protein
MRPIVLGTSTALSGSLPPVLPSVPAESPLGSPAVAGSPEAIPSQIAPTAAIKFTNVMLDSTTDPQKTARTFAFTSDGPGAVSAEVVSSSPSDTSRSWPSKQPSIEVTSARFQGSPNPDSLRSMQVVFKPRAAGRVTIDASWGTAEITASVDLTDVSTSKPVAVDLVRYANATSISPAYSHTVMAGKTYRVELLNESPDALRPSLTATIAFP